MECQPGGMAGTLRAGKVVGPAPPYGHQGLAVVGAGPPLDGTYSPSERVRAVGPVAYEQEELTVVDGQTATAEIVFFPGACGSEGRWRLLPPRSTERCSSRTHAEFRRADEWLYQQDGVAFAPPLGPWTKRRAPRSTKNRPKPPNTAKQPTQIYKKKAAPRSKRNE